MKDIPFFFKVHFNQQAFSLTEKLIFAQDHEAKLVANNPDGARDEMIALTATRIDAVSEKQARETTAAAVQKARTATKDKYRKTIEETVSRQSGLVVAKLGKDSPAYLEFFPAGLTEFHNARDSEVAPLLERLIEAATAHLPELTPTFQELSDTWEAVTGEASSRRAKRKTTAEGRADAIQALEIQLTRNLLTLALEFLGQPEKANVFFNSSLLYNRVSGDEEADEGEVVGGAE